MVSSCPWIRTLITLSFKKEAKTNVLVGWLVDWAVGLILSWLTTGNVNNHWQWHALSGGPWQENKNLELDSTKDFIWSTHLILSRPNFLCSAASSLSTIGCILSHSFKMRNRSSEGPGRGGQSHPAITNNWIYPTLCWHMFLILADCRMESFRSSHSSSEVFSVYMKLEV